MIQYLIHRVLLQRSHARPAAIAGWSCFLVVHLAFVSNLRAESGEIAFERISFPLPERCDRAIVVDFDGDQDSDLVALCQTKIIGIRLPERTTETLLETHDGQTIHGAAWDADGDDDQDILFCRFSPGASPSDYSLAWLELPSRQLHVLDRDIRGVHGVCGTTMLDNVMLLFGSNMFNGDSHDGRNLPLVLAGHGGGRIPAGKAIDYSAEPEEQQRACNLYVSIAQHMGLDLPRFGDSVNTLRYI